MFSKPSFKDVLSKVLLLNELRNPFRQSLLKHKFQKKYTKMVFRLEFWQDSIQCLVTEFNSETHTRSETAVENPYWKYFAVHFHVTGKQAS